MEKNARAAFIVLAVIVSSWGGSPLSAAESPSSLPHLERRGDATQLIVDGKPFLALAGELQNSSATDLVYMDRAYARLAAMHLNTVILPVSWELLEPEEGKFDFTLVDGLIAGAKRNSLKLVFLWFGTWKNTFSSYVPLWVKNNLERFPRVQNRLGLDTERLSPFSATCRDADVRAFTALMRHIRETDGDAHTVVMVQVENEVGVIPEPRDFSATANAAFDGPVPKELTQLLEQSREKLSPEAREAWNEAGNKTSGSWQEVFGKVPLTDDLFMTWQYAKYIEAVTRAGKAAYPLPMFVNAALIRPNYQPGQYNSGGPLPHSMQIWRLAAPSIDFLSPDIYFETFVEWSGKYNRPGNPLFIPEAFAGVSGAANAFYAFGQEKAMGFSPFAIDDKTYAPKSEDPELACADRSVCASYAILSHLAPQILEKQASGQIAAVVLEGEAQREARVSLGHYTMMVSRAERASADHPLPTDRVSVLFLQTGPDEYIVAGSGPSNVAVRLNTPGPPIAGIGSIDEEVLDNGKWRPGRRLNGDEDSQGQVLKVNSKDRPQVVFYRVRLYRYR